MEQAVREVPNHDPLTPEEISHFVEVLVRHVVQYVYHRNIPDAVYHESDFTANIRIAVGELLQNSNCRDHDHWCEYVFECCRAVPRQTFKELMGKLGRHLLDFIPPLDIGRPSTCIRFFALASKLCMKFYEFRSRCGVQATKQSLKRILKNARIDREEFRKLDHHAKEFVDYVRTRRYYLKDLAHHRK